jgi:hypothetical protein
VVSVSDEPSRLSLNLRVDTSIKNAYEDVIQARYGCTTPYAGIELERELRYLLREGELDELHRAVDELSDAVEFEIELEKNKLIGNRSREDTTVVGYHIHSDIQHRIKNDNEDCRSSGKLIENVMLRYIEHGSTTGYLTSHIQQIAEEIASRNSSFKDLSATERRTKSIVQTLTEEDRTGFKFKEFCEAIDTAEGISQSRYVIEQYLPRVLDELNYTWHPDNPRLFVSKNDDSYEIPEFRDLRKKPKWLMTEEDEQLAIKLDAFIEVTSVNKTYSVDKARSMLNTNPSKSKVDQLMKNIADESPGYRYNSDKRKLLVKRKKIKRYDVDNSEVINVLGSTVSS